MRGKPWRVQLIVKHCCTSTSNIQSCNENKALIVHMVTWAHPMQTDLPIYRQDQLVNLKMSDLLLISAPNVDVKSNVVLSYDNFWFLSYDNFRVMKISEVWPFLNYDHFWIMIIPMPFRWESINLLSTLPSGQTKEWVMHGFRCCHVSPCRCWMLQDLYKHFK